MTVADTPQLSGIELDDDSYTIVQSLARNKYRAENSTGDVVLRGAQKMFKMKEEFPFTDADGNDVFTVKAGSISDVAGSYTLEDAQTGEEVVVLDNDYSIMRDTWTIYDAGTGATLAEIASRGGAVTLARNFLPFGSLIPHAYEITDADGGHVGTIDGQVSMKDTYEIEIDDASDVPKEAVVAAAMVIDAIEEN